MTKYKEIVYMVMDRLKLSSDDSSITEEHVLYLAKKFRPFILKQRYADIRKNIGRANYQDICFNLIQVPDIPNDVCMDNNYLRSDIKIPKLMSISEPIVYPLTFMYNFNICYTSNERFSFVGNSKYYRNIIYYTIGPDNYLYLKSPNPLFMNMEKLRMSGIFEDSEEAESMSCDKEGKSIECDIMDRDFPIEDSLVTSLIDLIVQSLGSTLYKPEDTQNNANDDITDIANKQAIAESRRYRRDDKDEKS